MTPDWKLPAEALRWLRFRIPGLHVVELGSGEGSAALASMCDHLTSIEHDPVWVERGNLQPIDNRRIVEAPIVNGWYSVEVLKRQLPPKIHAVIVDGPTGAIGRYPLLQNLDLFPKDVPLLIDDVNRPSERELAMAIAEHRDDTLSLHICRDGRAFATLGWGIP
jgi:hypothetical protein